jgi:peptide-methionine (S)-S-oxide reductase
MFRSPLLSRCAAVGLAIAALSLAPAPSSAASASGVLPVPAQDAAASKSGLQTAVFAGGCFWGVQAVFQHVKGITKVVAGYAGGTLARPSYEQVSSGTTGHTESVRVTFDPKVVSYGKLLQIFFTVALDPTQLDRQGPDTGTQYRSELFVANAEQERIARAYLAQLTAAHSFDEPIVTRIDTGAAFYPAEAYHQDYLIRHPDEPYIVINDQPKVHNLQQLFPEIWREKPVMVGTTQAAS